MSGEFRPEQNQRIESTDDPELAKRHGLTQFDKKTGQYTAPTPPDAGQRDGADEHERQHAVAKAEGDAQHEAEHGTPPGFTPAEGDGGDSGEHAPKGGRIAGVAKSRAKGDDHK